jgi:CheY-like chemotaxis protein
LNSHLEIISATAYTYGVGQEPHLPPGAEPLSGIAHKLRTPLTVIMSTVNNLLDGTFGSLNEAQHKWLKKLETHTQNLESLLNDILAVLKKEPEQTARVNFALETQEKNGSKPQINVAQEKIITEATPFNKEIPTVLVVDDEPDILEVVQDGLQPQGYRILTASNGSDALSLALREEPDLILMDVLLENQNGADVCRTIKAKMPMYTPVILMTGQDDLREKFSGSTYDADDLLAKPFQMPELFMRVASMLRLKKLQRKLETMEKNNGPL